MPLVAARAWLLAGIGLWQADEQHGILGLANPSQIPKNTADWVVAAEALTCRTTPRVRYLQERSAVAQRNGFKFWDDPDLTMLAEMLWNEWREHGNKGGSRLTAPGSLSLARVLLGERDAAIQDYCLLAHVTAGFISARSVHVHYAEMVGNPEAEIPREVIKDMDDVLIESVLLLGHNRLLDVGKIAGWSVTAAQILEARNAIQRACPEAASPEEVPPPCLVPKLEEELVSGLLASLDPLPGPNYAAMNKFYFCPATWGDVGRPREPRPGSCQARAALGGLPCQVRVWYLGTHEALFREVEFMWGLFPEMYAIEFHRVNEQGVYNPAGNLDKEAPGAIGSEAPAAAAAAAAARPAPKRFEPQRTLEFHFTTEDVLDIQPAAMRFRALLRKEGRSPSRSGADFDAHILLCTIPAFACSAWAGLELPMVMYAANPATAQVPFTQFQAWLALFAEFAADQKNQLLVSNTWSQAQFEYQTGVNCPMIRAHGLYTRAVHSVHAVHDESGHGMDVLVYDRMSPLLSRMLEALRRQLYSSGGESATHAAATRSFMHMASTDRSYATFASFRAVVFNPGDVEQMAFYEFYSMGIPIFVPSDPSRYMWQQLPGFEKKLDETCGNFAAWVGNWEMSESLSKNTVMAMTIDCDGTVTLEGAGRRSLRELYHMDSRGFTHCIVGGSESDPHMRVRLQRENLQVILMDEPSLSCTATLHTNMKVVVLNGVRRDGPPYMQTVWDHDIFASSIWYLDAKLPGPSRWKHSPFRLTSVEAVHEWSRMMDYFRFPAVGLFSSTAALLESLASKSQLQVMMRIMKDYNECTLRQSTQQWATVLNAAVAG